MASQRSLRQLGRERVDGAISSRFGSLSQAGRLTFSNLLVHVRENSSLLQVTGDGAAQVLAIEALFNIARWRGEFYRWPSSWFGGEGSVYTLVNSLAAHIFGPYRAPQLFGLVWFGSHDWNSQEERRWYIEHVRGRRFRDIPRLPIAMTRKMERLLLTSPHDMPLRHAMRRAELLALGGEPELVDAVLATRLATRFDDNEFWRTVLEWFVRYWDELDHAKIKTIVDRLHELRRFSPRLSVAGTTPRSLMRLLFPPALPPPRPSRRSWSSLGLPEFVVEDEVGAWMMVELCDDNALHAEGHKMRHCVGSYVGKCLHQSSSIWSLRLSVAGGELEPRCTIEVDVPANAIVQVRGVANKRVEGRKRELIEQWAGAAMLQIDAGAWGS